MAHHPVNGGTHYPFIYMIIWVKIFDADGTLLHEYETDLADSMKRRIFAAHARQRGVSEAGSEEVAGMNALGYSKVAMVFAAHARVEGMVAENQQREVLGQSMAYTAADFNAEAAYMDDLAREIAEIAENGWRPD